MPYSKNNKNWPNRFIFTDASKVSLTTFTFLETQ